MQGGGRLAVGLGVLALNGCGGLLLYPETGLPWTPERFGIPYQDVHFASADGTPLHGWFVPADGEARGTILFLHGNAQNIAYHLNSVYWLPPRGYNVFLFDYRGYGNSGGKAELNGAFEDAEAALAYLRARTGVDAERLVVFGQSLGGTITVWLMAHDSRDGVRAVVVEGAFSDFHRIAREKLAAGWLTWPLQWPLSFLVPNGHSPEKVIGRIAPTPLLIVNGTADRIVPHHHAEILYRKAGEPKELWIVEGAPHIAAFAPSRPDWRVRLLRYLDERVGEPVPH